MWLLVGLGNPGRKYEGTRHNVGFDVVEELECRHGLGPFRDKFNGRTAAGMIGYDKVLLLEPMEFMNNSGFAVQRAAKFYNLDPERIVVVHDDLDLDVGRLKLKTGGGHGGHNGLRSIIAQLSSRDFARVRVGIGRPRRNTEFGDDNYATGDETERGTKTAVTTGAGYVLAKFPASERDARDSAVSRAADAIEAIVANGTASAMNQFNQRSERDRPDAADKTSRSSEDPTR